MVRIRKELDAAGRRAVELGLTEEEIAFYDTIAALWSEVSEAPALQLLVREIVAAVKRNLKVDWTEPHREDVRAAIRAAVKRTLRKHDVTAESLETILARVMSQAEALYAAWPAAA